MQCASCGLSVKGRQGLRGHLRWNPSHKIQPEPGSQEPESGARARRSHMAPEPVAPVNGFDDLVVDDEPAPPIDDGQPRRSRFDEALELAKRVLDEGVAQRRQDEAERAERQRREEEQAARLRQLLAPLAPLPVSPPLPAPRVPEARQEPEPAAAMGWG